MTRCLVLQRYCCVLPKTMSKAGIRASLRRLKRFITKRPKSTGNTAQSRPKSYAADSERDQLECISSESHPQRLETMIPETPWQRQKSGR